MSRFMLVNNNVRHLFKLCLNSSIPTNQLNYEIKTLVLN